MTEKSRANIRRMMGLDPDYIRPLTEEETRLCEALTEEMRKDAEGD